MDNLARLAAEITVAGRRLAANVQAITSAVQHIAANLPAPRKADPMPEIIVTDRTLEALKLGSDTIGLKLSEGEALGFTPANHALAAALVAGRDELDRLAAEIDATQPRQPTRAEMVAAARDLLRAAGLPVPSEREFRDALRWGDWSERFA